MQTELTLTWAGDSQDTIKNMPFCVVYPASIRYNIVYLPKYRFWKIRYIKPLVPILFRKPFQGHKAFGQGMQDSVSATPTASHCMNPQFCSVDRRYCPPFLRWLNSECSEGISEVQTPLFKKTFCISKWLRNLRSTPLFIAHGHWATHGWIQVLLISLLSHLIKKNTSQHVKPWERKSTAEMRGDWSFPTVRKFSD